MWNNENGDGDISGLQLASAISAHINNLKASDFLCEPDSTFIAMNYQGEYFAHPKFFLMAHYSRHIKEGMAILRSGDPNIVTAYDPGAKKLVLVTRNREPDRDITWDLSAFKAANPNHNTKVRVWRTQTNGSELYNALPEGCIDMDYSKHYRMRVPRNSIVTLEIEDIQPKVH